MTTTYSAAQDATTQNAGFNASAGVGSDARSLLYADISDTVNLVPYAKALRIYNGSGSSVTLLVTPLRAADDTTKIPITVPSGQFSLEPIGARRVWVTGSTGLITTGAITSGVEVILITG